MNILLVGMNFGNYEKRIVYTLEKQGHKVFYMFDTDKHYTFYNRILGPKITKKITALYQDKMIRIMPSDLDKAIIIVGRQLTSVFFQKLKKKNPAIAISLYLWDDVQRVESFEAVKDYYDEIFSFDLKDCKEYGFKHLPLFYTERPNCECEAEYDIYSAMFSHSERERIVKAIADQADVLGKNYKFFISLGRYAYFKRRQEIKENRNKKIIYISEPIDEKENYRNMSRSKIILDVQFSSQIGLTMRTIESLGMKNKLITTNPSVRYYDFYNENNIMVIDREAPMIDSAFFSKPYKEIPESIYEKYSLDIWVKTLTGEIILNNYVGNYEITNMKFE